ncbi:unnamed protein product [Soboliphyme baturini]|uniref:PhoLip_ATPase_C domain-containing protein n=1 Tax=Soboliphyme baturini TaxID=241478 RepID=A0A183IMW2_9BILA|nr:unnamed protein product [Soboliphyme baturini]
MTTFSLALPILSISDSKLLVDEGSSPILAKAQDIESISSCATPSPSTDDHASLSTAKTVVRGQRSPTFSAARFSMTKVVEWSKIIKLHFPIVTKKMATRHGISEYKNPIYEAESPDELAIVYAAAAYGFRLMKRGPREVFVELPNRRVLRYEIAHVLPFDSVRKRMSVILRNPFTNEYVLYCKGADSAIMELLAPSTTTADSDSSDDVHVHNTEQCLNLYASYGLRTLCIDLPADVYNAWLDKHQEAEMSLDNHDQLLHESSVSIEQHLQLLGVTGVEDRLQQGVPECISSLRQAAIKVWVLTGDKIETAVNVSYGCKLFSSDMDLIQISVGNYVRVFFSIVSLHNHNLFSVHMTFGRNAVLCCRITPLQKASIVKMVKSKLHVITLAIGDGANDVPMIQCADVGIGISGQEGMQAVMASDYAMPRFKYLKRLLLVHGHWCYDRLARVILYFFYKNAVLNFVILWFQFFCGFSAQVMIDPTYLQLYNLAFTSLPPIVFALLDQDVSDTELMRDPKMYRQGSEKLVCRSNCYLSVNFSLVSQLIMISGIYVNFVNVYFIFTVYYRRRRIYVIHWYSC